MAEFITSGSEYNGEEALDIIVRPSLVNQMPTGLRLIETNGSSSVKKTYMGPAKASVVPYADGFQGGNESSRIQKKFELAEYKSENQWSKQDYKDEVLRQLDDIKNSFQNDFWGSEVAEKMPAPLRTALEVMPVETAMVRTAEWMLQQKGIGIGVFRNFWLGDTAKITHSTGTFPNQVVYAKYAADIRYNAKNGVWKNIQAVAATTPSDENDIQRVDVNSLTYLSAIAVAQVDTLTFTGTGGTATVTAKGVATTATFDTDLATTAENFVTANAAAYAAVGLTLTYPGSGAAVVFTSDVPGSDFDAVTIANLTTNLAGTRAATTANTDMGAIKTDGSIALFNAMIDAQPAVMDEVDDGQKVIYATKSVIRNYEKSLGVDGTNKGTLESMRQTLVNGVSTLSFNGIRIEQMRIDEAIRADFNSEYPHRAILSVNDNLALVQSSAGKFGESLLWFEKKDNKVLTRTQFEMGGDYFMPELMVAAY